MIERNRQDLRAFAALTGAIEVVPGDTDHPAYDELESLVDGRLDEVDREIVESHIATCRQCKEDLADLRATRDLLSPAAPTSAPARSTRWYLPAIAAVAAAALIAVWVARQPAARSEQPRVAVAPSTSVAPPVVAATPDPLSADERALIDRVTASGRLEIPETIAASKGQQGTLLGSTRGPALVPIAPLATALASTLPAFSWNPVKGAQAYTVAVYDERFKVIAQSPRVTQPMWVATTELPRDQPLLWQVTAHLAGSTIVGPAPPQPEARFRILDRASADAAGALRARLEARPLELGILLARAGLLQDAAEQLRRAETDAATAATAKALRANLP